MPRSEIAMFDNILNLSSEQKEKIEKEVGPLKSVTEFCSSLLESTKEIPLKEKFVKLLPWAAKGGKIVGEITPLAKVLVKIAEEIAKEKDPEVLGLIACSLAYQRSAALALAQQGEPKDRVPFERSLEQVSKDLAKLKIGDSLAGFSLAAPLAHPFIWQSDDSLYLVVGNNHYSESEWRQIQSHIHDQFRADLVEVLSHGETAAKFEPFVRRLSLGDSSAAYAALNAHVERQRWLFEDRPVLNIEPFTLSQVYVDTDCGRLKWKDFPSSGDSRATSSGERFDPFSEKFGGRYPLLEAVLGYLRNPKFNDAIVIQGAPGCGKSSFTLRLANELRREGLRPLRIRLKFLNLKKNLAEALAEVVLQPEEDEDPSLGMVSQTSDPFLGESIFQEKTKFGEAEICPYVLILDGWDEISVAVNEGFEIEVQRMLESVRREFLDRRVLKIRVILTGRPSHAVERSLFLRDDTPVLTVREYSPDQLESYVKKLRASIDQAPGLSVASWPTANWNSIGKVVASYRKHKDRLDILGLPLLAHLSLRLLAEWKGETGQLLSNRTMLYRHLLDVTCAKAGKAPSDPDDLYRQLRISGAQLRKMLQQTAVAITTYGNESIPFRELQLRLKKNRKDTMAAAESAGKDHPLTSLMISFYFKGGRENLGCEFLHKSFREYLYAEAIVEVLKAYGQAHTSALPKREPYWKDFERPDPRRAFSRELSQILCPRPLTREIVGHLEGLLEWEIQESSARLRAENSQAAPMVSFARWEFIRDSLNDLWDWWGEGVHLRPQPYRDDSDNLGYSPAFVSELSDYSLPRDRGPDALEWWPGRLVNADANVGDALCRLNSWVHSLVLKASGWMGAVANPGIFATVEQKRHMYQTRLRHSQGEWVLFRPSGSDPAYFRAYCSRINAAGNRPWGPFPTAMRMPDTDFTGAELLLLILFDCDLRGSNLQDANLEGANLSLANFSRANASRARLNQCQLFGAQLSNADFQAARLIFADLGRSFCDHADFRGAKLWGADLRGALLNGADFSGAEVEDAKFNGAQIEGAIGLPKEILASVNQKQKDENSPERPE